MTERRKTGTVKPGMLQIYGTMPLKLSTLNHTCIVTTTHIHSGILALGITDQASVLVSK